MNMDNKFIQLLNKFFASKTGIIFVGAFIGVVAAVLQHEGNPGNMGFCIACFQRDIAGALGLHSAGVVQYLRPEIMGIVLGSLIAALVFKEFRARTGSAPIVRFVLGFFAMIGALVFLGCPWRAMLRLSGGDLNAILGLLGLASGVFIGTIFIRKGYNLGRNKKTYPLVGLIIPAVMITLLIFLLWDPEFEDGTNVISTSTAGPGSMYAPVALSFGIALAVGFFAQRSRFCTIAGIRDTILIKDIHLLLGVFALIIAAFAANLALDQFTMGFEDQPVAHTDHLWNYLGMVLAGLAFVLAGGCPGRQLVLSGEGDADSGIFIIGMITGAAFSHNFKLASSPAGTGEWGPAAVILGLVICLLIGFFLRDKS
jgi:YedE family putative selenium metabolism protein